MLTDAAIRRLRGGGALMGAFLALGAPAVVRAQSISTQVFETTIPFNYTRGRDESVTDRPR